jgi:hypothetical protein
MEREPSAAIKETHEAMHELRSKKKNNRNTIQAYVKECDALKAMLVRAEKAVVSISTGVSWLLSNTRNPAGTTMLDNTWVLAICIPIALQATSCRAPMAV